jgi:hypothetical protein
MLVVIDLNWLGVGSKGVIRRKFCKQLSNYQVLMESPLLWTLVPPFVKVWEKFKIIS